MPWFKFTDDPRVKIPFRDGVVVLEYQSIQFTAEGQRCGPDGIELGAWIWVAYREDAPETRIILCRFRNVRALLDAVREFGFEVEAGSPQHRIMNAATKLGLAEQLPDVEAKRLDYLRERHRGRH